MTRRIAYLLGDERYVVSQSSRTFVEFAVDKCVLFSTDPNEVV
jgi:hypothetical protein